MIYLMLCEAIVIIVLLVLYVRNENMLSKKISEVSQQIKEEQEPLNRRRSFRVEVSNTNCLVKFIEFGDYKLLKLKDKEFYGDILNISSTGLKFSTVYELPVKRKIIIMVKFKLLQEEFTLKGQIVRREDHIQNEPYYYGVQFFDLSLSEKTKLTLNLNQMSVKQKQHIKII